MKVKELIESLELVKNSLTGYEIIEDGSSQARLVLRGGEKDLINAFGNKEVVRFSVCDKVGHNEKDLYLCIVIQVLQKDSEHRYYINHIEVEGSVINPYALCDKETESVVGTELNNFAFYGLEGAKAMLDVISKYAVESPRKEKCSTQIQMEYLRSTNLELQEEIARLKERHEDASKWEERFDKLLDMVGERE